MTREVAARLAIPVVAVDELLALCSGESAFVSGRPLTEPQHVAVVLHT
jgi:hypothetical protein